MLGVNVATCYAGKSLCCSPPPFYGLRFIATKSSSWRHKSKLAARTGLSLAYMDFLSPGHPGRVDVPGLILRLPRHSSSEPVRSSTPDLSVSGWGQSTPITRCPRSECRFSHLLLLPLPFGTFIPQDRQPLRAAFALSRNTCENLTVAECPISLRSPATD